MSELFFTADHHFGHKNIIKFADRPWHDRDTMDEELIAIWNATVPEDGVVMYGGDFSFRGTGETMEILARLNGTKHLIRGNHDKHMQLGVEKFFTSVSDYSYLAIDELRQHIALFHYALRTWEGMHYGSWQLHGHSHGKLQPIGLQLDIGIDNAAKILHQYRPFTLMEIKAYMDAIPAGPQEYELDDAV